MVRTERQLGVGEQRLGVVILERRPLELEEQQPRLDLGRPLLHEREQRPPCGVGGVGGEAQRRERARPADQLVDLGQLAHRRGEAAGVQLGEPAGVRLGERPCPIAGLVERPLHASPFVAVDQRGQIPGGLEQLRILEDRVRARHLVGRD